MTDINSVCISGNLTKDPEVREAKSGISIMSLSVAINERVKNNRNGEWEEYVNFIPCTLFGKRAETIQEYLRKGMRVTISGKLRWSKWVSDEVTRSKIEVIVDQIEWERSAQKPKHE